MAKTIRNARSGEFRRVANDVAVQMVSSGQWTYSSKFEEKRVEEFCAQNRARLKRFANYTKAVGAALAIVIAALLLFSSHARAADKPIPFRVCLTQSQAAQVYKGKLLKYRLIKDEHGTHQACWYSQNGKAPKKAEFIPRSVRTATRPALLPIQEQSRVEGSSGAVPEPRANTAFTNQLIEDAFLALTGEPEPTFEALWTARTGWAR